MSCGKAYLVLVYFCWNIETVDYDVWCFCYVAGFSISLRTWFRLCWFSLFGTFRPVSRQIVRLQQICVSLYDFRGIVQQQMCRYTVPWALFEKSMPPAQLFKKSSEQK